MELHTVINEARKLQRLYNIKDRNMGINFPISQNKSTLISLNEKHKLNNILSTSLRYKNLQMIEPIFDVVKDERTCTIVLFENKY